MSKKIYVTTGAIVPTAESTVQYLREIKKTAMLTKQEEQELAAKSAAGDRRATNALVQANLR